MRVVANAELTLQSPLRAGTVISRAAHHSIGALAHLARLPEGEYAGAVTLARQIDAPHNYLGKILHSLTRVGLVASRKGLGGGFRLARDPASIRLLDVVEALDHAGAWEGCLLGRPLCTDDQPCPVHERWSELRHEYASLLSQTTIADVACKLENPRDEGAAELER